MIKTSCLLTGGGGAGSEAIYRLMQDRYSLHFADAEYNNISQTIDEKHRHSIPYANDPSFVTEIIKLCNKNKIDLLVPTVDEELLLMQKIREKECDFKIMAPDYDYTKVMLDKLESIRFLDSVGISVPKTVPLQEVESINFPCIAKPRWGRGSRNVFTLQNSKDVSAYLQLTGISIEHAVGQELLKGEEYTVTMVADNSYKLHTIVPAYVKEKRGITISAAVVKNKGVLDACKRIHAAIPTKATYNIQLMLTSEGEAKPFEINPRISTTFCLALAAGIDPFSAFLGEDNIGIIRPGMKLHRHWINEFTM